MKTAGATKLDHFEIVMNKLTQERFDNLHIKEPNSGCWIWTSEVSMDGYGKINFFRYDRINKKKIRKPGMRAHRVSYMFHSRSRIPAGILVLHKCDTPLCVNPSHLFLGTNKDNMADMAKKGRGSWQKRVSV